MGPLVTPSWLAGRLLDPSLIVLDATLAAPGSADPSEAHRRYLAAHLPGAVLFDIDRFSDPTTSLPHMLPDPDFFGRALAELGVASEMTLVVYEQGDVFSAPRARWMLRTMGAREVYLLDGGLPAWLEAGLPVESGPVERPPSAFHVCLAAEEVKNLAEVQQMLACGRPEEAGAPNGRGYQILDARSAARFAGRAPEPRPGIASGHMPGAVSLPYTEVTDGSRFQPVERLRETFARHDVDLNRPITTSCGSGVTAAVVALALELAGARQVSLYDGSWAEYAQHPGAVIERDA